MVVGTIVGFVSSPVGIVGMVSALFAFDFVTRPRIIEWRDVEYFLFNVPILVIYVFVYTNIALVPATMGGCAMGLILHLAARARHLNVRIATAIGILVGFIEGGATAWIIAPLSDPQGWFPDVPRGLLWNAPIGIAQGLFVSIILFAWLGKMQHRGDDGSTDLFGRIANGSNIAAVMLGIFALVSLGSCLLYDSLLNPLGIAALGGLFAVGVLGAWLKWRTR